MTSVDKNTKSASAASEELGQWLQTYTELLIAWELSQCEKLANELLPLPTDDPISMLFQSGTQAIKHEQYQEALDMLKYLKDATVPNSSQRILIETYLAPLLVFIGRIYLYKVSEPETSLKYFEEAKDLAPDDGLPYSALGDYYRWKKDTEMAEQFYTHAIEQAPKQPNGYIGKGLLEEDQTSLDVAIDYYEKAIKAVQEEKDVDVGLSKLLAPISGTVYLQLARMLRKRQASEHALQAVIKALDIGIRDETGYFNGIAFKLKGELLQELQRPIEAADAYYKAAWHFNRCSEYDAAIKLLTLAQNLNSNDAYIYWELSDAFRMSSYPTPPSDGEEISLSYDDEEAIQRADEAINKSLAFWRQAYKIGLPEHDTALFYFERALINQQLASLPGANRWALYWEGIVYLERALLLEQTLPDDDTKSDLWTFLGYFHHGLGNQLSALYATRKAIEYNDKKLSALDTLASILVLSGKVDEAETVIDKRQRQSRRPDLDARKAFIRFYKGHYQDALEHISRIIEDKEILEKWYRELRAACYLMLDMPAFAKEEFEWLWNDCEKLNYNVSEYDLLTFGLAACYLDRIDKAIDIFNQLRMKNTVEGSAYCRLGLAYLMQGDLQHGEESLDQGIAKASNQRELESLVKVDFALLKKASTAWSYGTQVCEILDRLQREKINTCYLALEQRHSIEDELEQVVEKYPLEDSTINWTWLAAQAGLARFYAENARWDKAEGIYQLLQSKQEQFPEAHIGLEKIRSGSQATGTFSR